MKRRRISRLVRVISMVGLIALLAGLLPAAAPALAAPAAPQVTVFLKNYLEEYNIATSEFLADQFDNLDSPAYGAVRYTAVTTLTQESLAGSVALVIDESADMSLTDAESALIHDFVARGGKVALFTYPRFYWDHEGPNPDAFQKIADLFGNAAVGTPDEVELGSGDSKAGVSQDRPVPWLNFTMPYSVTGSTVENFDKTPFTPITSSGTTPVLTSPAFDGMAVAVANSHGLLVTNPIGDMVQGSDANPAYKQFVTDSILWLAGSRATLPNQLYLPLTVR